MARIRSIHPGLFTDEAFITVSIPARLLFVGLLTECDDNGVFEWKPLTLKMRLYPADNMDVIALMSELSDANIMRSFAVSEKSFGAIRNFRKWQRPKSPLIIHPITTEMRSFVGSEAAEKREDQQGKRGTALGRILLDQQNGSCFYCEADITFYRKKPNSLEVDHKTPVSRGGSDDIDNLCACCRPCNSLKANMTEQEFRDKFAPSELLIRHGRRNSQSAKNRNDLSPPQREEGGGRMEEEDEKGERGKLSPPDLKLVGEEKPVRIDESYEPSDRATEYAYSLGMKKADLNSELSKFIALSMAARAVSFNPDMNFKVFCDRWLEFKRKNDPNWTPSPEPAPAEPQVDRSSWAIVIEGTQEHTCWNIINRERGLRPLFMCKQIAPDGRVYERAARCQTLFPKEFNDFGERIAPATAEDAA